ncbi:hypothetical protein Tco_1068898 [Tanacetum coccineum]|uniref:Uncharacterized protein n=1 Tax=Tanacetum coccineum TaxID=301880 RepID=A0ABQ5HGY9_9ASTR
MSFLIMLDEITLESLTEEQFDCISIEYSRENYPEDYKSDLENLKDIYKTMNGGVEYPRTQNASPSEIKEPYEPSPRMYSYEQPSCLGSTFVGETFRKSDQMHQTIEKSLLAMTHKLDDMIELPKSQPKRIYNKDLECEIVMVKIPKCMAWLDDKPIGELDTMEDKTFDELGVGDSVHESGDSHALQGSLDMPTLSLESLHEIFCRFPLSLLNVVNFYQIFDTFLCKRKFARNVFLNRHSYPRIPWVVFPAALFQLLLVTTDDNTCRSILGGLRRTRPPFDDLRKLDVVEVVEWKRLLNDKLRKIKSNRITECQK